MQELNLSYKFKQDVQPESRGRVRFCINSIYGYMARVGYQLTPNFLAHKNEGERDFVITHKRSGRMAASSTTLANAKRLARRLEKVCDWSRVGPTGRSSAIPKRAIAKAKAIVNGDRLSR